jgi:agmatine deiminase
MLPSNKLYFSSIIHEDLDFLDDWNQIKTILDKHKVNYDFIKGTTDLFVRDFMPLQLPDGSFIQFRYEPSYLDKELEYRSDPKIVNEANGFHPKNSDINLDGGNVVRNGNRIIMTERIFAENPEWTDQNALIKELERLLDAEILLIKDYHKSTDVSGHADGMIRWKDENSVLINEMKDDFEYMRKAVTNFLEHNELNHKEIPWFEYKEKKYPHSGIGLYINYLQIKELIIIPKFEIKDNLDDEVLKIFENIFPDKHIEQANINNIAKEGGLLNCISWDIYEPELTGSAKKHQLTL